MMRLLSAGGMFLPVGLVLLIIERKLINDAAVGLVAALTMLLGPFIMAFGLFSSFPRAINSAADRHNLSAVGKRATAETRRLLPGDQSVTPADSVIDKTTDLFNVEPDDPPPTPVRCKFHRCEPRDLAMGLRRGSENLFLPGNWLKECR